MAIKTKSYIRLTKRGGDIKRPRRGKPSIQEQFETYRRMHPETYRAIIDVLEEEREAKTERISMSWVFDELRRRHKTSLPNSFRSRYTRLIFRRLPWTRGIITHAPLREKDA